MSLIAFDQTLANTGWALFCKGDLRATGMIITPVSDDGWRGNIRRGTYIEAEVDQLFFLWQPTFVVCEMPTTVGRYQRPESSALAAQAISIAASRREVGFDLVSNNHMKKVLLNVVTKVTKAQVRAAVEERLPDAKTFKPYNEHVVDAIALGLTAIHDGLDLQGATP